MKYYLNISWIFLCENVNMKYLIYSLSMVCGDPIQAFEWLQIQEVSSVMVDND